MGPGVSRGGGDSPAPAWGRGTPRCGGGKAPTVFRAGHVGTSRLFHAANAGRWRREEATITWMRLTPNSSPVLGISRKAPPRPRSLFLLVLDAVLVEADERVRLQAEIIYRGALMGCTLWGQLTQPCDTKSFGCNVEPSGSRVGCKITKVRGMAACRSWGWNMAGPSRAQVGSGRCFPSSKGPMSVVLMMLLAGQ